MKIKILFLVILLSSLSVTSSFAARKKHPVRVTKGKSVLLTSPLIPPKFAPVPVIADIFCGKTVNMGITFYVVRSTDISVFGTEVKQEVINTLETCVIEGQDKEIFKSLAEEAGPETTFDQVTCSRQKAHGFPETFTAVSTTWKYLHPERLRICFDMLKAIPFPQKEVKDPNSDPWMIKKI